ncbi:MAG: glycoside hydrolase family 1 protein [Actinomycetota bacterium]
MSANAQTFPEGFRWGTATAAHQIEGGNTNNDWWEWEHNPESGCKESSGDACDSWHRWPEDVALLKELGFTDYRFSLEWSRIEPADGEWSVVALDHYAKLCEGLLDAGIDPVVTFHHFTTPTWLARRGGWELPETADRFAAFCEKAADRLSGVMRRACTINEPNIVSTIGHLAGVFPPGKSDAALRRKVNDVFVDAHRKAVAAIRSSAPGVPVGLTLSMSDYQAVDGGESKLEQIRRGMEDVFLDATTGDDFVGVQTYSRSRVGPAGVVGPEEGVPTLIMGYEYYPQALEATIRRAWERTKGEVPIIVTENGIGTDDDSQRLAYVRTALEGVLACLADGIDVRGYTYWSLLDNFEWALGYGPRFGIVDCDRTTFARTPKESAHWLGRVARANALVD